MHVEIFNISKLVFDRGQPEKQKFLSNMFLLVVLDPNLNIYNNETRKKKRLNLELRQL
jgi:hypothetical protein